MKGDPRLLNATIKIMATICCRNAVSSLRYLWNGITCWCQKWPVSAYWCAFCTSGSRWGKFQNKRDMFSGLEENFVRFFISTCPTVDNWDQILRIISGNSLTVYRKETTHDVSLMSMNGGRPLRCKSDDSFQPTRKALTHHATIMNSNIFLPQSSCNLW